MIVYLIHRVERRKRKYKETKKKIIFLLNKIWAQHDYCWNRRQTFIINITIIIYYIIEHDKTTKLIIRK
jgi:hypothetical protein